MHNNQRKKTHLCPFFYVCNKAINKEHSQNQQYLDYCLGMTYPEKSWNSCIEFLNKRGGHIKNCPLADNCIKKHKVAKKFPRVYYRMCLGITDKGASTMILPNGNLCGEGEIVLLPIKQLISD